MTTTSDRPEPPAADGRATRWHGHKARRRADVIDAAITVIEESGVEVSVQQIADRLKLPRPVVYRHFDGRTDLDEQIRRQILESLLAQIMPTLHPDGTVRDAVRGAISTYVRWVERHPNLHRFIGGAAPQGETSLAGARDRIGARLADMFALWLSGFGIDQARARPMAFGIIGFVDGVVNSWRADAGTTLTCDQVEGILTESVLALFEGNARSLGVPLERDLVVRDLLVAPEALSAR
ncbi:TetR family transcriptional regulator [Nocardia brasiliensis]|uniref:TetR family transcriptional regulator n=1 Tax=Nocardia brasiliensis TaxID=37326 RepID=A0A6G9XUJ6_NOCBR|nr:TetR/AcrR family transcriptional regulator [Nocardia brasiliensis]QIS04585.1 TetR family transcriptional regulator [Nocardia brasiliensis]